jgi:hypothetical protein
MFKRRVLLAKMAEQSEAKQPYRQHAHSNTGNTYAIKHAA